MGWMGISDAPKMAANGSTWITRRIPVWNLRFFILHLPVKSNTPGIVSTGVSRAAQEKGRRCQEVIKKFLAGTPPQVR